MAGSELNAGLQALTPSSSCIVACSHRSASGWRGDWTVTCWQWAAIH